MGGSFSREIGGSFSGRERALKGFKEFKGGSEVGPGLEGLRVEEEGVAAEGKVLGGAEEGGGLEGASLGGAASRFAFRPAAVFFF